MLSLFNWESRYTLCRRSESILMHIVCWYLPALFQIVSRVISQAADQKADQSDSDAAKVLWANSNPKRACKSPRDNCIITQPCMITHSLSAPLGWEFLGKTFILHKSNTLERTQKASLSHKTSGGQWQLLSKSQKHIEKGKTETFHVKATYKTEKH